MADPIVPDHYRAMAVMQHNSGAAEHRFVNSFVFENTAAFWPTQDGMADACAAALDDFYFGPEGGPATFGSRIAWNRITNIEYRVYDLGEAPPRTPFVRASARTKPNVSTNPLPFECSVVLSLRTELRDRAGRGRVFLGPWTVNALAVTDDGPTIDATTRNGIVSAATQLMNTSHNVRWVVLSAHSAKHAPAARPVIGGYVDHAWDTQRRRGWPSDNRDTFGTVL